MITDDWYNVKHYLEAHITIEPVFDTKLLRAKHLAEVHGFKIADLLMKKRTEDTEERSSKDTFMTTHSKLLCDIKSRTEKLVIDLKLAGFKVWRYKIEDIVMDSRIDDELNLF